LPPATSSTASTGPISITSGSRLRSKWASCRTICAPPGEDTIHSASPLAQVGEHVSQPAVVRLLPLDGKPRAAQRCLNCVGGCLDTVFLVSEQIHVLRGPADDPVREQRVPAPEREPVPGRRGQGDGGDLAVQLADGHQPGSAVTERRTG
jgi:hypothetical protein